MVQQMMHGWVSLSLIQYPDLTRNIDGEELPLFYKQRVDAFDWTEYKGFLLFIYESVTKDGLYLAAEAISGLVVSGISMDNYKTTEGFVTKKAALDRAKYIIDTQIAKGIDIEAHLEMRKEHVRARLTTILSFIPKKLRGLL